MCGIVGWAPSRGFIRYNVQKISNKTLSSLRHRGPDDSGAYVFFKQDGKICSTPIASFCNETFHFFLGHTRLAILDLSKNGKQPFFSSNGRYALSFNGEVYNYIELRQKLIKEGYSFFSSSDTEVVLNSLIHWGPTALSHFAGMFAIAFFDSINNTLLCARDCFGIKPFFWHNGENGFTFASEIQTLLQFPFIEAYADAGASFRYLRHGQYGVGCETMFRHIYSLPPAHYFELSLDETTEVKPIRYWSPDLSAKANLSFNESCEALRTMFIDSVRIHLRSDVPFGVALSGGIDSSAIACVARKIEPEIEINTFSFISSCSETNENQWIAIVNQDISGRESKVFIDPQEIVSDFDNLILSQGEPFGSSSIYAQYRVFQLAKECGVTVSLEGQGADELLAGYQGYPGERAASLILGGHPLQALRFLIACYKWPGRSVQYLLRQLIRELIPKSIIPLAHRCVGRPPFPQWLDKEALLQQHVTFASNEDRLSIFSVGGRLKQALASQLIWNGLPSLLRHSDRNSMAHSIESRVPFLTRELAEFCLSLPEEHLIGTNCRSKNVFREAMRGIVPQAILDRRDKIGFSTPERYWMKAQADWVTSILAEANNIPYFHPKIALEEWRHILNGKRPFDFRVWRWICYVRWAQLFRVQA